MNLTRGVYILAITVFLCLLYVTKVPKLEKSNIGPGPSRGFIGPTVITVLDCFTIFSTSEARGKIQ